MATEKAKAPAPAVDPTWFELVLITPSVAEEKLQTALLLTASEDREWGKTALQVASVEPEPANNTFYPFFLHSVCSGPIPPSPASYAVIHH